MPSIEFVSLLAALEATVAYDFKPVVKLLLVVGCTSIIHIFLSVCCRCRHCISRIANCGMQGM
jgi:hypothetical protein